MRPLVGQSQECSEVGVAGHDNALICVSCLQDLVVLGFFQTQVESVHSIMTGIAQEFRQRW